MALQNRSLRSLAPEETTKNIDAFVGQPSTHRHKGALIPRTELVVPKKRRIHFLMIFLSYFIALTGTARCCRCFGCRCCGQPYRCDDGRRRRGGRRGGGRRSDKEGTVTLTFYIVLTWVRREQWNDGYTHTHTSTAILSLCCLHCQILSCAC